MTCPTCDHTMAKLRTRGDSEWYWCPRCGTLRERIMSHTGTDYNDEDDTPKLVERCRMFEQKLFDPAPNALDVGMWERFGVAESINLPNDRPAPPAEERPL